MSSLWVTPAEKRSKHLNQSAEGKDLGAPVWLGWIHTVPFCETASNFKHLALRLKERTNLMPLLAVEISSIEHKREIPRPSESI